MVKKQNPECNKNYSKSGEESSSTCLWSKPDPECITVQKSKRFCCEYMDQVTEPESSQLNERI